MRLFQGPAGFEECLWLAKTQRRKERQDILLLPMGKLIAIKSVDSEVAA